MNPTVVMGVIVTGVYDLRFVALSIAVAIAASYTALNLAKPVTAAQGYAHWRWLWGGATAMGVGIWSMHFIGMLAYRLPVPITYDLPTVLLSMAIAIASSGTALFLVSRQQLGWRPLVLGSLLMGAGIAAMHYVGMTAMRSQADDSALSHLAAHYTLPLVLLSGGVATGASFVALWLAFQLRRQATRVERLLSLGAAVVLGNAIAGMHYIGMAAVHFTTTAQALTPVSSRLNSIELAIAIGTVALVILALTLLASFFDQRIAAEVARGDALRQSEERFRSLVQNASDIIAVVTAEGRISYTTPSVTQILGFSGTDWLGHQVADFVHPEDVNKLQVLLTNSLTAPATAVRAELRLRHYDRDWRVFDLLVNDLLAEPTVAGLVLTFRDVTERKRTEESLTRLVAILEETTDLIGTADLQGHLLYSNKAFRSAVGIEADANLSHWSIADCHPEWARRIVIDEGIPAALQTGIWTGETALTSHSGQDIPTTQMIIAHRAAEGSVEFLSTVIRDMTERKRAEERLRLLESVVVHANDAVVITEAEPVSYPGPRILYVNKAFTQTTGYTLEEVVGKTPRILQGPQTDRATLDKMRSALQAWQPLLVELRNYRKDGSEFWVEQSLVPIANEAGWYTHWVSIQRDITERKQAEAEIRKALEREKELSELKSHFVSMASHEFRTPLAAIQASSDLLKCFNHKLNDIERQERLSKIQTEVKVMTRLLDNILLIHRAEAGQIEFQPDTLNLATFCQTIVQEFALIAGKTHRFTFSCQGDRSTGEVYEELLRQMLTNLLSNAVKYSPEGGTIEVTLVCEGDEAIVRICDSGIGIPAAEQIRLFDAFQRASNVGTIPGTGLGLSIVKGAVERHGGSITLSSEVGKGTTFTIRLPMQLRTRDQE